MKMKIFDIRYEIVLSGHEEILARNYKEAIEQFNDKMNGKTWDETIADCTYEELEVTDVYEEEVGEE